MQRVFEQTFILQVFQISKNHKTLYASTAAGTNAGASAGAGAGAGAAKEQRR